MREEHIDSIKPDLMHIRQFLSVFKDSDKEICFRQEILPKHRRLTFKLCILVAVAMPLFMFTDYMIVKPDPWGFFLMVQRLLQILLCLIYFSIIPRVRRYLSYDILLFSTLFIFLVFLETGSLTYVDDYALYAFFDIIIMICLYASGILPLKLSLILCGYHTVVAIVIILFVKKVGAYNQMIMILGYSISNGVGILLAIAQHRAARQAFFLQHTLREKTLQLKQLAYRDSLTDVFNRRAFQDHFRDFEKIISRAENDKNYLILIAADIDHFKSVNDSFGHDVGDKVLIAFTTLIESLIRPQDKIYRFGGEEFMVLLQDCEVEIAVQRVEELMQLLNNNCLGVKELEQPVTCSFGITPILTTDTVDSVCIRADEALYVAKHNGRNQYVFDSGLIPNLNTQKTD
jgi:diguanylate cyclase (GGDEF)-like protein